MDISAISSHNYPGLDKPQVPRLSPSSIRNTWQRIHVGMGTLASKQRADTDTRRAAFCIPASFSLHILRTPHCGRERRKPSQHRPTHACKSISMDKSAYLYAAICQSCFSFLRRFTSAHFFPLRLSISPCLHFSVLVPILSLCVSIRVSISRDSVSVCLPVCLSVCSSVCLSVCINIYMYIYVYICIYIYIYIKI